jgi:hypothetical protein
LLEKDKPLDIQRRFTGWEDDVPTTRVHVSAALDEVPKSKLTLERLVAGGLEPAWKIVASVRALM